MFAGIGGFRLGFEKASSRFRIVWANEWDKYACQIYRKNFGEKELQEGDIKKVNTKDIPDFDLLCGGFPCQPHSLAGKRRGFSDERGEVFHEIVRVAKAKQPKMLLLENVKGLLSSEQGRAFGTVLEELGNIGYWCEWKTLNSKYFGVPQNRERVFIIGHLRGSGSRQIFPIECDGEENYESGKIAGTLQGGGHSGGLHSNMTGVISKAVRSRGRASTDRHSWDLVQVGEVWEGSQCRVYDPNGIAPTVHKSGGNTEPLIIADRSRSYAGLGRNFESPKPYANTLSGVQKDNLVLQDSVRRLTERECERLQGFPDDWTSGVSSTQRYKMLGNAVTVNVIQAIGELILEAF